MPAAGGRHGSGERQPGGSPPHLPSVGAVFAGGHRAEAAMKTLNAMALGARRPEASPPLTSSPADRRRGEAAFQIRRGPQLCEEGGTVRRITGGSLPAGLRGAAAPDDPCHLEPEVCSNGQRRGAPGQGRMASKPAGRAGMERIRRPWRDCILSESVRRRIFRRLRVQVLYLSAGRAVEKRCERRYKFSPRWRQNGTI